MIVQQVLPPAQCLQVECPSCECELGATENCSNCALVRRLDRAAERRAA